MQMPAEEQNMAQPKKAQAQVIKLKEQTNTDEQRMAEIAERFEILDQMTASAIEGTIRAMIVTGPPGVGKSFGVEQELDKMGLFDSISGRSKSYEIVKGAMTPIGLYCKLYQFSGPGNVLVFDDCDSVLMDDLSLNILKAALDSGKKRRIYWNADSHKLRNEGVPDNFEFEGSVIFITNIKFENVRSKRLKDHLEALESRCHYLDLTLDTMRDKLLRIKQISEQGDLFRGYGLTTQQQQEIIDYMRENATRFREMSLRTALKVADLVKTSPNRWKTIAQMTCMKR